MGPCRITKKSPRGVCGADADLIVARNLLRWVAAGVAAHGARGREIMLALKAAGEGILDMPVAGEAKLRKSAAQLGISTEGKTFIVDFVGDSAEEIENLCIVSNRNGEERKLDAKYDPQSKSWIATGSFGYNHVPGSFTVEYNLKKEKIN